MPDDKIKLVVDNDRNFARGEILDLEFEDVRLFYRKFDLLISDQPRWLTREKFNERMDCMTEELREFAEAVLEDDIDKAFDALIDLVYFAKGTAVMMGLPWAAGWAEVQRANMAKVRGVTHRGHKVDVKKPPGWQPPNLLKLLTAAGYDPTLPPITDKED